MGQHYEGGASTPSTFTLAGGSNGSRKRITWRIMLVFFLFLLVGGHIKRIIEGRQWHDRLVGYVYPLGWSSVGIWFFYSASMAFSWLDSV